VATPSSERAATPWARVIRDRGEHVMSMIEIQDAYIERLRRTLYDLTEH
jgi:hypothetical protein